VTGIPRPRKRGGPRVAITPKRSGLLGARVPSDQTSRRSPTTLAGAAPLLPRTGWNALARGLGSDPGSGSQANPSSVTDRRDADPISATNPRVAPMAAHGPVPLSRRQNATYARGNSGSRDFSRTRYRFARAVSPRA
jgi:hypothetical protein